MKKLSFSSITSKRSLSELFSYILIKHPKTILKIDRFYINIFNRGYNHVTIYDYHGYQLMLTDNDINNDKNISMSLR